MDRKVGAKFYVGTINLPGVRSTGQVTLECANLLLTRVALRNTQGCISVRKGAAYIVVLLEYGYGHFSRMKRVQPKPSQEK